MRSVLLTVNAGAGSADRRRLDDAVSILREHWTVELAVLENAADLDRALDRRGDRLLVVAGGDGTLHHAVQALYRRNECADTLVGLLPLGTGNDFARWAELPLEVGAAARTLLQSTERDIDLIVDDTGGVVVNNVHLGVGADASRRGARWKKWIGRIGYGVGLLGAVFTRAFRLDLWLDGEQVAGRERPVLEVSIGNGRTVGGGLPLHPGAEPTDGRLDVIVSFAAGRARRVSYGIDLFRGRHPERPDVLRRLCDTVSVAGDSFRLSADGEIQGPITARTWRVQRGALRMLVPR